MNRYVPVLACIAAISLCAAAQRPGGFHPIGPGGGGAMFHPTISPIDPSTALVACDMTGSYITHDGGRSWRMFNLRGPVRFFVFDPQLPGVIYAETSVLWRSRDNGATWKLVSPSGSSVKDIAMSSDHAEEEIVASGELVGPISALAVDRQNSKHLYASAGKEQSSLIESNDAGEHWVVRESLPEPIERMWITSDAAKSLVMLSRHLVLSRVGLHTRIISSFATAPLIDASAGRSTGSQWILYRASAMGLSISVDGGSSWKTSNMPGNGTQVRAVGADLKNGRVAYASYGGMRLDSRIWHGVARTDDAGETWHLVWKESDTAAENVQDAWITRRFGTDWGENPLALAVSDVDSNLVYATDMGRTMITRDGGKHWTSAYSRRGADGGWVSTGLDVTTSYGVHFDPFDSNRQFITYTDIGLFRSESGGASWMSSTAGVPKPWLNTTYWMVFDPKIKGRAWSVNSGTHDLPRPKMWRHTSTDQYRGGVCRSEDGGRTWIVSSTGMPDTAPTDIVLDPSSPANARILYVTAFGRGVYKSVDDGKTWRLKNVGIRQMSPLAWRLTLAPNGTLYLVIARRSENGSIGNDGDGALYQSVDGAESWQEIKLPAGVNGPNGLAIDPAHPGRLYLAAWARAAGTHGEGGGIFRSEDQGAHWSTSLDRDQHIYDVTVDPRLPGTVYAAGFESSAWVSRDNGANWSRISGFNFKWAHRVVLDPKDAASVYITTFGGGVWHGKVETAPSILDIATPELEPHR